MRPGIAFPLVFFLFPFSSCGGCERIVGPGRSPKLIQKVASFPRLYRFSRGDRLVYGSLDIRLRLAKELKLMSVDS